MNHIYKITTWSYEEHSELFLMSKDSLSQKELDQRFQRIMVSVVSRLLSGGDEFGPSAARSFGSVFSEITDDDLASEGFERFIPEFVSSVSAWSGPGSIFEKPHTKDDPGDITVSLNEELVEKNLIPPPFEWSDYGDDDLQE